MGKADSITRVVIIGCKGSAMNLIQQIKHAIDEFKLNWIIEGICIDEPLSGALVSGIPVLCGIKEIKKLLINEDYKFLFALYKPEKMTERADLLKSLMIPGHRFVNFIHPLAYVAPDIKLGFGNIILSNATIQSGVTIGNNNYINSSVVIEHDTIIGDSNFLAAGSTIGSEVAVGDCNFIGLNASVREKVRIGTSVYIGMGAAVLHDFSEAKIYGVPAKKTSQWS